MQSRLVKPPRSWLFVLMCSWLSLALVSAFIVNVAHSNTESASTTPVDDQVVTLNVPQDAPLEMTQTQTVNVSMAALLQSAAFDPTGCTKLERGPGELIRYGRYVINTGAYRCYLPNNKVIAIWCIDPLRSAYGATDAKYITLSSLGGTTASSWRAARGLVRFSSNFDVGGVYGSLTPNNADRAGAVRSYFLKQTGHPKLAKAIYDSLGSVGKAYYTKVRDNAINYSGPYTITKKLRKASIFGRATYSVTITSARGKPVPGLTVAFSNTGATPSKVTKRTYTAGTATEAFRPTSFNRVVLYATIKGLTSSYVNVYWRGGYWDTKQRFIGPRPISKKVGTSFTPAIPVVKLQAVCPGCTDKVVIRLAKEVCNTGHGTASMYVGVWVDGTVVRWYLLKPGECFSSGKALATAHGFVTAYPAVKFVYGTRTVTKVLSNKVVQDCLPWPEEQAGWSRNCTEATITRELPAQDYPQRLVLVVDGVTHTFKAAAGQPITATMEKLPCAVDHTWEARSYGTNRLGKETAMWHDSGTLNGTSS